MVNGACFTLELALLFLTPSFVSTPLHVILINYSISLNYKIIFPRSGASFPDLVLNINLKLLNVNSVLEPLLTLHFVCIEPPMKL